MSPEYISYETLVANRDAALWAFWSMIGTWVAGVMTFAAVCVSLVVSFRRPKPKLKGSISHMFVNPTGTLYKGGIGVSINNQGANPVSISMLTWNFGKETRLIYAVDSSASTLPKRLEHGESALFFFWNDENCEWAKDVKSNVLKSGGKIKRMRLEVSLGTGDVFYLKPPEGILKIFCDA